MAPAATPHESRAPSLTRAALLRFAACRSSQELARLLPADHLPLAVAFEVLFTAEEREEIGFEGFLSDLDARPGQSPSSAAALRSISLEEALDYLRSEQ